MPPTLTYPGVYIDEVSSGVHTVTGVATSIAAFAGAAPRGPVNEAVHLYSFADYERAFGGLDASSEMSYGVRQFFQNGGTEAYAIRIVKSAAKASLVLQNESAAPVLLVTALDAGFTGNDIQVVVAPSATSSAFDLTVARNSDGTLETYRSLSLNSNDLRYALDLVNGVSSLVRLDRQVTSAQLAALGAGRTTSGALADVATLVDATHNEFQVSVNGLSPVTVTLALPGDVAGADAAARLATLCAAIQQKVTTQAAGVPAYQNFTCTPDGTGTAIAMVSGAPGETSSVRVLAGAHNDASGRLQLGTANGGVDADAIGVYQPTAVPARATLTSGNFAANTEFNGFPSATSNSFVLSIDGGSPQTVVLAPNPPAAGALAARLQEMATRITAAVVALQPLNPAYANFTCTVAAKTLVLATGTPGSSGSVAVSAAPLLDAAAALHLLAEATTTSAADAMLGGGTEVPYGSGDIYPSYIGNRSLRQGIYALEAVDLFNLLVLPGITDAGTLADATAYCKERRAFFIIDSPASVVTPADMITSISGNSLPKSEYAAVYYPWLQIADPLKSGKLRPTPPSGSIAGIYASTDSDRGVWKAPAGTETAISGALALTYTLTDRECGGLNPLAVNCLRSFTSFGVVSWGARTLLGADAATSDYKYVPVRRLALYIEESLYRGTQWVVFEPNDEPLWSQIRLNVGSFMNTLFRQGAFQGKSAREAYLVKCDNQTTTQDDINRGVVNILVAFAPLKPAEFVVITIQQLAGQIQT
jgi:phage tail sheath protein FI